jgi:hypothetical protein
MRANAVEGVQRRELMKLLARALLRKDTYVVRRDEFAVSFVMLSLRVLTALSRSAPSRICFSFHLANLTALLRF